ncbi:NAD(P)-binding protein [Coniochaeta hoffmannii]|uniref:Dehydrogenase FUB6 n=1 Tax=Coniochaeta hoffmannii TaxID=91930 RepID=A0AA38RKT7_9PEZI|nr:NAD(P)-binding protein [Coniochaeta hoffmannii]
MTQNKTLIYKKIPEGFPVAGEHLVVEDRPIDLDEAPPSGGLVVKVLYASFDPYLRGKMRDPSTKSYSPPFQVGQPITNDTVSKILKSDSPDFKEGETVLGYLPIAEYVHVTKEQMAGVRKINNPKNLDVSYFLGPLGMPGLTGYSALHKIGKPKKGETLFVSSAAGAVGQVVGQVAKREGLRVIGSVGSDAKLDFITKELGFDGGFNYKKEKPLDALKRLAPDGIDIYFENVGGEQLQAAIECMNPHGRIAVCGMISGYNQKPEEQYGVTNLINIVSKRLVIEGFIVSDKDFGPAYAKEHQEKLQQWLADGSVKAKLHVTEGIDKAAEGLVGIFKGENFGKAVLKVADA